MEFYLPGPTEKEKKQFIKEFTDEMSAELVRRKIKIDPAVVEDMANKFVEEIIKFRQDIEADPSLHQQIMGETVWTEVRARRVTDFSESLDKIFAPVGGIKPGDQSAFWSGQGVLQAKEQGIDFQSTIPGYLVNKVGGTLMTVFMPGAYADNAASTSANVGMWEALSKLYSQGTVENAHVYLTDGVTSKQSVFWNVELQELRERQARGLVKDIIVHTLQPEAKDEYKTMLDERNALNEDKAKAEIELTCMQEALAMQQQITTDDQKLHLFESKIQAQQEKIHHIEQKLEGVGANMKMHLQDPAKWHAKPLEKSDFKIKTSGFNKNYAEVSYQQLTNVAARFKALLKSKREMAANPNKKPCEESPKVEHSSQLRQP